MQANSLVGKREKIVCFGGGYVGCPTMTIMAQKIPNCDVIFIKIIVIKEIFLIINMYFYV